MKLVQITFLAVVFTLAGSLSLYAQKGNRKNPEDAAKQQTEWMVKELGLNKVQAEKVKQINEDFFKTMTTAREKHMGDREAMKAAMKNARKAKNEKLKEVLTKEQMEKYNNKVAERRQSAQNNRKGNKK
ncbi:MAG: hypothetical protein GXO47_13095 [Chlorobi bacterium]|nr:hypothetical protein [Chlorobiota bacterium]